MTAFACCVNARRQPARPATPAERPATPARHPRQGLDGSDLELQLARTLTFTRCAAVAERLLGRPVEHRFDHAIYKPAFNGAATSWHQDEAYALERKILSAHFWVPLQDVTRDMGCMEFIPGGPRGALGRHHRRDRLRDAHALELVGRRDGALSAHGPLYRAQPDRHAASGVGARVRSPARARRSPDGQGTPRLAPRHPLNSGGTRRPRHRRPLAARPGSCESRVFWVLRRFRR